MNFLPFLFSFLLIFSIGLSLSIRRSESTAQITYGSKTFLKALHAASSKRASKTFLAKFPEKSTVPKIDKSGISPPAPPSKTHLRKKKCTKESEKFNLSALLDAKTTAKQHFLYPKAIELLRILYCHAPFYTVNLEHEILDALIENKDSSLEEIFASNPRLDTIFYHMRQGTTSYEVETSQGFPSIWDYFSLAYAQNEKMNLYSLSTPVLKAIVGDDLMKKIEYEEREKKASISIRRLGELAQQNFSAKIDANQTHEIFQSSHKDKTDSAYLDDDTDLLIRY